VSSPAASPSPTAAASPAPKLPYATVAPARTTITNKDIILATTTSVRDSGLLDVLIPIFQQQSGYQVKTIAIGTGAAIAMGSRGDADVLVVHDPPNEVIFMNNGNGTNRQFIAHNAFIIVGPTADPAKIKGSKSVTEAFGKIAAANATFVTRGDASGTNSQELRIWNATGIDVSKKPAWYISTGQGMGATLTITSEKAGYTISDRATYLASKKNLQLDILYENNSEPALLNIYHVIQVNPDKYKDVNAAGAKAFDDFMISPAAQKIIGDFGIAQYGEPLFYADYGKKESDFGSV
jgi:tungstate transport system substrate-binding protein